VEHHAPAPSPLERYCAWYGDSLGDTLYFGISAFWWALRGSGGNPEADLLIPGPQLVGRFDLERTAFDPPLDVTAPGARGGVWDVLAHPDGRIWFTTYFDAAGFVDPATGEVRRLEAAGLGLNELALGPEGHVLVTRYGYGVDDRGSVVVLDAQGGVVDEYVLAAEPGVRPAAKSLAWDPLREEIWVNTDLLAPDGSALGHDTRVLDREGRELERLVEPEIQFMRFEPDGTGWYAELEAGSLWLRVRTPEEAAARGFAGRRVLLDTAFLEGVDFVQELRPVGDGSALLTRWSGRLHRVWRDGRVVELDLPRDHGLYYTGVVHDDRVCVTLCDGVTVTCMELE
jgi:hypothetical protein